MGGTVEEQSTTITELAAAFAVDVARKLFWRLREDDDIPVECDHVGLKPHSAGRGAVEAVYRSADTGLNNG